jgi:hypothetical protein
VAENLVIESPEFDEIEHEAGSSTRNAVYLLWAALNNEIAVRRRTVRDAKEVDEGKLLSLAPTAQQDNLDTQRSTIVLFTGASNFSLTGIRNGIEGQRLVLFNVGTATITLEEAHASSDVSNRLALDTGADKTLGQNAAITLLYLNSKWREANWL